VITIIGLTLTLTLTLVRLGLTSYNANLTLNPQLTLTLIRSASAWPFTTFNSSLKTSISFTEAAADLLRRGLAFG
jgi:hypothetical protein